MDANRFERLFQAALADIDPELNLRVDVPTHHADTFWATLAGRPVRAAWLAVGWPRQVRSVLARQDRPDLIGARELSPGARSILTNANVSWFDETGAARIALPGVLIHISPTGSRQKPPRRNLGWTPGTLAVCEALLTGRPGAVTAIAKATGMAPSTVATSLRFLQEEHYLESEADRGRKARRTIVDPLQLLDAYAAAASRLRSPESVRVGVLWRDPSKGVADLGAKWEVLGLEWCATSAIAADVIAPILTEVAPMELYVDARGIAELRQAAREVDLDEARGGRLLLRPFPTPSKAALSTRRQGIRVAPWPRVYADLRTTGVRGEDAAEHLREHFELELRELEHQEREQ